jgi:hypothetical protein
LKVAFHYDNDEQNDAYGGGKDKVAQVLANCVAKPFFPVEFSGGLVLGDDGQQEPV